MSDTTLKIEKMENGYEVEICDPDIMEQNDKNSKNAMWKDPWKSYAFGTVEEVAKFVSIHLGKLKPPPGADEEYAAAFKSATKED